MKINIFDGVKMKKAMSLLVGGVLILVTVTSCSSWNSKEEVGFRKLSKTATASFRKNIVKPRKVTNKKRGRGIANASGTTPNGVRYREDGSKPETGKSGGRVLQVWALMDKDNQTTVHVTTGNLADRTTEDGTHLTKSSIKV